MLPPMPFCASSSGTSHTSVHGRTTSRTPTRSSGNGAFEKFSRGKASRPQASSWTTPPSRSFSPNFQSLSASLPTTTSLLPRLSASSDRLESPCRNRRRLSAWTTIPTSARTPIRLCQASTWISRRQENSPSRHLLQPLMAAAAFRAAHSASWASRNANQRNAAKRAAG